MMRQYYDIKGRNPGSILFFRLGDFYEMFDEDARIASKELDIVLTTRDRSGDGIERMPMCGVPYHSAQPYIARLIAKGYKVAICEQLEDPMTVKGIVDRDVVRVITPGTLMESSMLDADRSNYLCAVYISDDKKSEACFADLSTGEISATKFPDDDITHIENELASYCPAEAIIYGESEKVKQLAEYLETRLGCFVNTDEDAFRASALSGITETQESITEKALISYLTQTQKTDISHFQALRNNNEAAYMEMDLNTIYNLELVSSLRTGDKKGSLLWVLDKTKTPMGRRLIRAWVLRPLLSVSAIGRRSAATGELFDATVSRGELILHLRSINDIERLIGKIAFGNAGCRDLKALSGSICVLPQLVSQLGSMTSAALRECAQMDTLTDIAEYIDGKIIDDPPFSVREAGFIKDGVDPEVDRLRGLLNNSSQALTDVESKERERTGKKLKIGYNKVFGYYIEIPRSVSDDVPVDYTRKQTLANCERFITQELKELETELLSAKDTLATLEFKLFEELRNEIAGKAGRVQQTARRIAELDVLCSFAEAAVRNKFCMPEVDASDVIDIKDGRHPVVELMQEGLLFVPNDTFLDCGASRTAIITGPNMAGKSTYMRQSALIVLMAQMGSFVPARSARIGLTDRVFTRIGASDDLSAGKSTFMVEMTEAADILASATARSLLILDEIGRGTSTYDGMSIARAILEFCTDKKKLGAKTMFSTHYHELTSIEGEVEGVKNYNISAKKRGDDIIFLRKIVPGSADDSYGIEVAGLAGIPAGVIKRAKEVLANLEGQKEDRGTVLLSPSLSVTVEPSPCHMSQDSDQLSLMDMSGSEIAGILNSTNLDTLSPIEALSLLYELKKKL